MIKWFNRKKEINDKELLLVFEELVALIKESEESLYSGIETKELINIIEQESINIRTRKKVNYNGLKMLFVPTGPIQEISIDNGWGQKFIDLANRYDTATLFRS